MIKSEQAEIVRSAKEVQRAHDILIQVVCIRPLRELVLDKDPEQEVSLKCMKTAASVLCWVLGHEHNRNFDENLRDLEDALRSLGLDMHDSGRLIYVEEEPDGPLPS